MTSYLFNSWFSDFDLDFDFYLEHYLVDSHHTMVQSDIANNLMLFIGYSDLYFTVH